MPPPAPTIQWHSGGEGGPGGGYDLNHGELNKKTLPYITTVCEEIPLKTGRFFVDQKIFDEKILTQYFSSKLGFPIVFFQCGVDSGATLITNTDEISNLGIEFY